MTSNKPYLIRAIHEWLLDNDATPYLLVNTQYPQVMIPPNIDKDGQVVLNIAPSAVQGLDLANDHVAFSARFGGRAFNIYLPMGSILAIYSAEDNEGMMFPEEPAGEAEAVADEGDQPEQGKGEGKKRPGLRVVK